MACKFEVWMFIKMRLLDFKSKYSGILNLNYTFVAVGRKVNATKHWTVRLGLKCRILIFHTLAPSYHRQYEQALYIIHSINKFDEMWY